MCPFSFSSDLSRYLAQSPLKTTMNHLQLSREFGQLLAPHHARALREFHKNRSSNKVIDLRRIPDNDFAFCQLRWICGVDFSDLLLDLEGVKSSRRSRYLLLSHDRRGACPREICARLGVACVKCGFPAFADSERQLHPLAVAGLI